MRIVTVKPEFGNGLDIVGNFSSYTKLREFISKSQSKIILDLSDIKWITPSYIIPTIALLKTYKEKIYNIIYPCQDAVCNYLKTIGFPDGVDVSSLKCPTTYLPILDMSIKPDEKKMDSLFQVLDKNIAKEHTQGLKYMLSELTDNIYQHSQFKSAFVMAQVYNALNEVEIAICDNGIGISGSYKLHSVMYDNDADAIMKAYNGISTKKEVGRGYGISSSADMAIRGFKGNLLIVSNKGTLIQNVNKLSLSQNYSFKGTCICIRFKFPKKPINIYKYLRP